MNVPGRIQRLLKPQPPLPLDLRIRNQRAYIRERLLGVPLPPTTVMSLVTSTHEANWYVESGKRGAQSIRDTLEKSRLNFAGISSILDFGCGCGRVLRHWRSLPKTVELHGTDYNLELVLWCRKLVPFARIERNQLEPPLVYADNSFDLIYALSTFTHWPVELQKRWIREFTRVLRPGGLLLFTGHGDYYLPDMTPEERELYAAGVPVVRYTELAGSNTCGAFHPFAFVQNELRQNLDLLRFYPLSALGNPWQDIYLLRKPHDA